MEAGRTGRRTTGKRMKREEKANGDGKNWDK